MQLTSNSIAPGHQVPARFALGKPDPESRATFSDNLNPHLSWSDAPDGTRSFAIVVHDRDAPADSSDANQPDRTISSDVPRTDFYHWILIDIDPSITSIDEATHSTRLETGGKPGPEAPDGLRHGMNSYTQWFAGNEDMAGEYHGYDGPFPPWNDEKTHAYVFTVYALDVDRLPVEAPFDGDAALAAMNKHVLDSGSFVAYYSLFAPSR